MSVHPRRIYVASSWRNEKQPDVVRVLRNVGHEVYDFRNPAPGKNGFAWRDCGGAAASDGPGSGARTIASYLSAVRSDRAREGFKLDEDALKWCDTCILVLPCGRSAHLEAGYAAGAGKDTYILLDAQGFEPELMYLLGAGTTADLGDIIDWMAARQPGDVFRWHQLNGGTGKNLSHHAVRALHEMVELCVASGASQLDIAHAVDAEIDKAVARGEFGGDRFEVPREWADCAMLLEVFARHAGIDRHAEIRRKLDVLWTRREWHADEGGALYGPRIKS